MRVSVYIDGFNLYYAIKELNAPSLKWLDLEKLAKCFLESNDVIQEIYLFTSPIIPHNALQVQRKQKQDTLHKALETTGIKIQYGNFKNREITCQNCSCKIKKYEEKESDVNIAVQLTIDSYEDKFDKAFIVTSDSDLASTIKRLSQNFTNKRFIPLICENRWGSAGAIRNSVPKGHSLKIKKAKIRASLLPNTIPLPNGDIIHKPQGW